MDAAYHSAAISNTNKSTNVGIHKDTIDLSFTVEACASPASVVLARTVCDSKGQVQIVSINGKPVVTDSLGRAMYRETIALFAICVQE